MAIFNSYVKLPEGKKMGMVFCAFGSGFQQLAMRLSQGDFTKTPHTGLQQSPESSSTKAKIRGRELWPGSSDYLSIIVIFFISIIVIYSSILVKYICIVVMIIQL